MVLSDEELNFRFQHCHRGIKDDLDDFIMRRYFFFFCNNFVQHCSYASTKPRCEYLVVMITTADILVIIEFSFSSLLDICL